MKKIVAFVFSVLCMTGAHARSGHFQGFYAGFSLGHQSISTSYTFPNAQLGNISGGSVTPIYINGQGSWVQRGLTGSLALGGGYLFRSTYFGVEIEGGYGLGTDANPLMIENVGTYMTGSTPTTYDLTTSFDFKPKQRLSASLRLGYLLTPKVLAFISAGMARSTYTVTRTNVLNTDGSYGTGLGIALSSYTGGTAQTDATTAPFTNMAFTPVSTSAQSSSIVVGVGTEIALTSSVNFKLKCDYEMGQSLAKLYNIKPSVLSLKAGIFYYF